MPRAIYEQSWCQVQADGRLRGKPGVGEWLKTFIVLSSAGHAGVEKIRGPPAGLVVVQLAWDVGSGDAHLLGGRHLGNCASEVHVVPPGSEPVSGAGRSRAS